MKKLELVRLINDKQYLKHNLQKDMRGIVVSCEKNEKVLTLFFNPHNMGEYVVVEINSQDIIVEKEKLPKDMQIEILQNLDSVMKKASDILKPIPIKEYDLVELIVEDDNYSKFGVHKGDRGCVIQDYAVQNYIEVDFSGIDENGNFYGDCISVKIEDLKIINWVIKQFKLRPKLFNLFQKKQKIAKFLIF